jgi:hypothetical protein
MTSPRFKGRLLGANKQIECSTQVMNVATGNSINLAGDLASRFLLARLDTGLERPEDRSASTFSIPNLRQWIVDNRQPIVAAVHTIVRGYRLPPGVSAVWWHTGERRRATGGRWQPLRRPLRRAARCPAMGFPDTPRPLPELPSERWYFVDEGRSRSGALHSRPLDMQGSG